MTQLSIARPAGPRGLRRSPSLTLWLMALASLAYALQQAGFAVGTVVCAVAPSISVLIAGRIVQGVGGAICRSPSGSCATSSLRSASAWAWA